MGTAKRLCTAAAVGLLLSMASTTANAALVNIINYIDADDGPGGNAGGAGEQAVTGPLTIDGVTFNAGGSNAGAAGAQPNNGVTFGPFAYLDGGGAGMGVCQWLNSGGDCAPASDDNVTGADPLEILSLSFDETVRIDALYFRDDGHNANFGATAGPAISVQVNGGGYNTKYLETGGVALSLGATLYNDLAQTDLFSPIILLAGQVLDLKWNNQQFYLAGFEIEKLGNIEPVPLPAGIILLLSGLAGLGASSRFRKKVV